MKDEFENLSIYLDESGATGGNFLDNAQPFYVQAGFIIQDSNLSVIKEVFEKWEAKRLKPRQTEIKGNRLFRNKKGFDAFEELYKDICPYILCPTFSVLDKKYGLCITIVEAFLDSFYNPLVETNEFFWEGNRPEWAEIFYTKLDLGTLELVNSTVLKADYSSFVKAHELIVEDLLKADEEILAKKIQACPREDAFKFLAQPNKQISSNGIAFRTHIFSIKNELVKYPPKTCRIFHDEQPHYESIFKDFIDMSSMGTPQVAPISKNKSIVWGAVGEWSLGFERSHNSPMIKIADLLCSYLKETLGALHKNNSIGFSSQNLYNLLWTPMFRYVYPDQFQDMPEWFYVGVPVDMQLKLIQNLKSENNPD